MKKRVVLLLFLSSFAFADQITIPNPLTNNTVADAEAVQYKFNILVSESNENDGRLTNLESMIMTDGNLKNIAVGDGLSAVTPNGQDPLSGVSNTAVGFEALLNNIEGWLNVAVGHFALEFNETGTDSTGVGAYALRSNIDASFNTGLGSSSLSNNTAGSHNTAIGWSSLNNNLSAAENTAIGSSALFSNTTGYSNTANGFRSLSANVTGWRNTAVGWQSLLSNTGINNTAVGADALYSHTTGEGNTAIGNKAMDTNTTGQFNTAMGHNADVAAPSLENATAIGHYAIVDASDKIQLGNTNVTSVATFGRLTTGEVTYPNVDGVAGTVLKTNGEGFVGWSADSDTLALIDCGESPGYALIWDGNAWGCSRNGNYVSRTQELEAQVASLQDQLQSQQQALASQQDELLAIVQSQQEQIAQLQRMVEHQFAAR